MFVLASLNCGNLLENLLKKYGTVLKKREQYQTFKTTISILVFELNKLKSKPE